MHRFPNRRAARRGFSLTEMMVAALILAIVGFMSAVTFLALTRGKAEAVRRVDQAERGRVLAELLANDFKAAVTLPAGNELRGGFAPTEYRLIGVNIDYVGTTVDVIAMADTRGPSLNRNDDGDVTPGSNQPRIDEDPWNGIDDDGDGLIDEDPGTIPRDMVNFVSSQSNRGLLDVVEVGYALSPMTALDDPTGYLSDRLFRRYREFDEQLLNDNLGPLFGRYTSPSNRLLPWVVEESLFAAPEMRESFVEIVDYDVVGLDLLYWYYDHALGRWAFARQWDSGIDQATQQLEWTGEFNLNNLGTLIQNRPRVAETGRFDERSDGLPYMIEIRIFVQDRLREFPPKMYSGRAFMPSG